MPKSMPSEELPRINAPLVPAASEALRALQERTRLSKTDLVNRALQLYEFLDAEKRKGMGLLLEGPGGITQMVKIF